MSKTHNLPPEKTLKSVLADNLGNLYKIVYTEGGVVPKELGDYYNSRFFANKAIDTYKLKHRTYLHHVRDKENAQIEDKDRK